MRDHFWVLLNEYARKQNYEVVKEVTCLGTKGKNVRPDGIIRSLFGLDIGLWESKDEKTPIDVEIDLKIRAGYPLYNILFEDSTTAILYQRGEESMRVPMRDADKLHTLITAFINFKSETVYKFEVALENFKADIPKIVEALRASIEDKGQNNAAFIKERTTFLDLCKAEINPEITLADIREMMIQHMLTSDIFNRIFGDPDFHRHNTIARELEKLIEVLFTYSQRRNLLGDIDHYYQAIGAAAAEVSDHHEKQKFLKVLYENFYKVYNPKAADRLGVVYTPNEIVEFMIESTDYLLGKHFGKSLADNNVDILDPATGTGTFITSIIDHIPTHLLANKYKNELHANEVAILPYYIANLNVEFTFKQKMGYYEEFKNLCFVDTLDNVAALKFARKDAGHQTGLFGVTSENSERIKKQNEKRISVVIGNPPYNANQANENDNNKNREYPIIDKHIKETFIKQSTAQKTKVYDMYARFYRWAMDRLDKNGIIAFITNRSFIDSRSFDGFRKNIQNEFDSAYIIDLGGDIRTDSKGTGGENVFEIKTGVAIMFLIKVESNINRLPCNLNYYTLPDNAKKSEKLLWLTENKLSNINFKRINSNTDGNWINIGDDNYKTFVPLIDKNVKTGVGDNSIFKFFSWGNSSNRDEWVYDLNRQNLKNKAEYLNETYNQLIVANDNKFPNTIKWSRDLKLKFNRKLKSTFNIDLLTSAIWRPYIKVHFYNNKVFNDVLTSNHFELFGSNLDKKNRCIMLMNHPQMQFGVHSVEHMVDAGYGGRATHIIPFTYKEKSNITDWALNLFCNHYQPTAPTEKELSAMGNAELAAFTADKEISKEDIFHYTYAVLHSPAYRKKYELDLKRDLPRLPLYADFWQWAAWGKQLMDLHIGYETVEPYALKLIETKEEIKVEKQKALFHIVSEPEALYTQRPKLKVKLKANKDAGIIELDEQTALGGVPAIAWDYKLGNRSALEWVLDQYKEKKPSDPTIAEKFNTYRFADYKDQVIDLLKRVCTVSVETMKVIKAMEDLHK